MRYSNKKGLEIKKQHMADGAGKTEQ